MLCGTYNIMQNIPSFRLNVTNIFCKILSVPQNIVMDLNNVMCLQRDRHPCKVGVRANHVSDCVC